MTVDLGWGLAVALVEYRFSGEARFPACLHDVKAAVRWLRRFGADVGVDGAAIGVWGESSGGHLAAFVALSGTDERLDGAVGVTGCSSDVTAAVAWYPDTDLLVFGHSHIPWDTSHEGLRLLNPGSPTDRRREPHCTYLTLRLADGAVEDVVLHRLPPRG